jgi:hypothetical protein
MATLAGNKIIFSYNYSVIALQSRGAQKGVVTNCGCIFRQFQLLAHFLHSRTQCFNLLLLLLDPLAACFALLASLALSIGLTAALNLTDEEIVATKKNLIQTRSRNSD